jgi:hypothetical protein
VHCSAGRAAPADSPSTLVASGLIHEELKASDASSFQAAREEERERERERERRYGGREREKERERERDRERGREEGTEEEREREGGGGGVCGGEERGKREWVCVLPSIAVRTPNSITTLASSRSRSRITA